MAIFDDHASGRQVGETHALPERETKDENRSNQQKRLTPQQTAASSLRALMTRERRIEVRQIFVMVATLVAILGGETNAGAVLMVIIH